MRDQFKPGSFGVGYAYLEKQRTQGGSDGWEGIAGSSLMHCGLIALWANSTVGQ